jgi:cytochrome c5
MWTRRAGLGVLALAILAAAAGSAGDGTASKREVYANEFPAGEARPLAERYCQICHAPSLVTQQAKDSTGWEKTLAQMEKWGIQPTPAEHDSLRGYLLSHFGPRAR